MSAQDPLAYEARVRLRQAVIAVLAGVLLVAASAMQLTGPHTKVDELTVDLITANKRVPLDQIAAVINALASLAIAATLTYLFGATRARNRQLNQYIKWIAIGGGALAAITGIAYSVVIAVKVHQFVTQGAQTYDQANHLTNSGELLALQLLGQAAALALAVAFVLVSLGAMRVGLLTRFMGYLGIFAGVLVLFQITQVPVVQGYWLVALGYLFSGRWPTGVPPAWRSGRAEPWASGQELRARRVGAAAGRAKPTATPAPEAVGGPVPAPTRSGAPKRKRKRKR